MYDIEPRIHTLEDGVIIYPGAARFVTAMIEHGSKDKLVLFSGDLFSPSNLGAHFKGE